MRIIADLHIHSKYSRATSKDMNLNTLALWAKVKGIDILGTGDFTHPAHFASIEELLEPAEPGLFSLKKDKGKAVPRFMLTAEVSNIYTQNGKTRKIHSLIFAPSMDAARKMNSAFSRLGNITSDGRPIFGFSAKDLIKIALDSDPASMLVPAHAWTPWFSIFGSKSGFDSIEGCFGEYSKHIYAIETGLSSNPMMNWRLSALDNIALISNSDAHSPSKLGREANVFDCAADYFEIIDIIKKRDRKRFLFTVEFFPEEGKYHYDGHRDCGILFSPEQTLKANKTCPVCDKGLTIGVMSRVNELADRPEGFTPPDAIPARHLVPLEEILAESFDMGVSSGKVKKEYRRLTEAAGSEFKILLDMGADELASLAGQRVATAIAKVRNGDLSITPGFDGEFGKVKIFGKAETITPAGPRQIGLF
ncbi:MAG: endonuclease Q family protein [Deltaproteobacteria bacterium]|nr:endonuclease Q family protein [Deltaproteobacteria bacterium]